MTNAGDPFHKIRRTQYVLLLLMAVLGTVGFFAGSMWLLGFAAWALIAAGLIEMIYRP